MSDFTHYFYEIANNPYAIGGLSIAVAFPIVGYYLVDKLCPKGEEDRISDKESKLEKDVE
jgi:protein involved in sex pheromone biosynthesis